MQIIILVTLLASASAFLPSSVKGVVRFNQASSKFSPLFDGVEIEPESPEPMGEESEEEYAESPKTGKGLFNMNRRVRLGRSRDQDGKSNIWSIGEHMFPFSWSAFHLLISPFPLL